MALISSGFNFLPKAGIPNAPLVILLTSFASESFHFACFFSVVRFGPLPPVPSSPWQRAQLFLYKSFPESVCADVVEPAVIVFGINEVSRKRKPASRIKHEIAMYLIICSFIFRFLQLSAICFIVDCLRLYSTLNLIF